LKGSIQGFAATGNNPNNYRQGTAFIKTAFITYGGTNVVFRFTNYKVYEVPDEATKATQDSDGNAINATYFKSSGSTTLVGGSAVKIGTQNGADVKLTINAMSDQEVTDLLGAMSA
jgi:hypothetical protein